MINYTRSAELKPAFTGRYAILVDYPTKVNGGARDEKCVNKSVPTDSE